MAKKFGKIVLFTAAIGSAAAAAYYFLRKKDASVDMQDGDDEDYDDFSGDPDEDSGAASRTYVPLNREAADGKQDGRTPSGESGAPEDKPSGEEKDFTPLTEQVAGKEEEKSDGNVEEFFDEDDPEE